MPDPCETIWRNHSHDIMRSPTARNKCCLTAVHQPLAYIGPMSSCSPAEGAHLAASLVLRSASSVFSFCRRFSSATCSAIVRITIGVPDAAPDFEAP